MKSYPLVFSFRDPIVGKGFVAGVVVNGRAILTEEDDGDVWIFGVQPGGVAGGDRDKGAAFRQFKENYLSVLWDIASETRSFDAFKKEVEVFFAQTNKPNAQDWKGLHTLVKRGSISLPGLERIDANTRRPSLKVVLLDKNESKPAANRFDEIAQAA